MARPAGGVAMSSHLQTDLSLPGESQKTRVLHWLLCAAEDTMKRRSHAVDPLASSKETSERLSAQRKREERGSVPIMWPWATAQLLGCMAQVMPLGTGLIKPGITAEDRGPSPRPIT